MPRTLKYLYLALQTLLFLFFASLLVFAFLGTQDSVVRWNIILPTFIALTICLVTAFLISRMSRSTVGANAQLLPLLFLSLTVTSIRVFPTIFAVIHPFMLSSSTVTAIFQSTMLFSSFLCIMTIMFQAEINRKKITQLVLIAAAISLFLGILIPGSTTTADSLSMIYVTDFWLRLFFIILASIGVLTMLLSILQENLSSETILKNIGMLLLLAGNTVHVFPYSPAQEFVSTSLFLGGFILLFFITKTSRMWQ